VFNRAKANNVRAHYKEFTSYLKNMIKLRAEQFMRYGDEHNVVRIPASEMSTAFEVMPTYNEGTYDVRKWNWLNDKTSEGYAERIAGFKELVQSGDTEKFHTAFLITCVNAHRNWGAVRVPDDGWLVNVKALIAMADEVLMKAHAEEVLDIVELPQGKLPNPKYASWLTYPSEA
jgi:hypothetical protein